MLCFVQHHLLQLLQCQSFQPAHSGIKNARREEADHARTVELARGANLNSGDPAERAGTQEFRQERCPRLASPTSTICANASSGKSSSASRTIAAATQSDASRQCPQQAIQLKTTAAGCGEPRRNGAGNLRNMRERRQKRQTRNHSKSNGPCGKPVRRRNPRSQAKKKRHANRNHRTLPHCCHGHGRGRPRKCRK